MNKKIDYKSITINNISIHRNSKLEFNDNSNVYPIIGLNGSGKTIFLNLLKDLNKTEYSDELDQKFTFGENASYTNQHSYIYIKLKNNARIGEILSYEEKQNLKNIEYEIENGNEVFDSILKFKNPLKSTFNFVPMNSKAFDTVIDQDDILKSLFVLKNKTITSITKKMLKFMDVTLFKFEHLSFDDQKNEFLSEGKSKFTNILSKENKVNDSVYIEILNKVKRDWRKSLKQFMNGKTKNKTGTTGSEFINIVEEINNSIEVIIEEKDNVEKMKVLKGVFNNLSGRVIDGDNPKNITTIPKILLVESDEEKDFHIKMIFKEYNIVKQDEYVEFMAHEKNDGYNLIFWYLIYISFKIKDARNTYILIDELGNYLNPKVIEYFLELLMEHSEHKTIYTTHNPYSIKYRTLSSIHICYRNKTNNYAALTHLKNVDESKKILSNNDIKNDTLRVVSDALTIGKEFNERIKLDENVTNVFVEGISDALAIKIFNNIKGSVWPIVMNGLGDAYKKIRDIYIHEIECKYCALVDSDFVKGVTGAYGMQTEELERYDQKLKIISDISPKKKYLDLEDIFLQSDLIFINELFKEKDIKKKNKLKQIKNKEEREIIKNAIIKELFEISQLSKIKILERDENYSKVYKKINNIIKQLN